MSDSFGKVLVHYVLYVCLLLTLCVGIFPFIILYATTTTIAELLDRLLAKKTIAVAVERTWDLIGAPYDRLVKQVG
jgi:hypothetical protein